MIEGNKKIYKKNRISYRIFEDKFVIINLENQGIYVFNKEVELLWNEIKKETTVDKIIEKFEVNSDKEVMKLHNILEQLHGTNLIHIEGMGCMGMEPIRDQRNDYRNYCDKNNILFEVMFEITEKCNLICEHCYMGIKKKHMERADISRVLKVVKEAGAVDIMITGGEIFTRDDAMDIIEEAIEQGFVVSLLTNATLLEREKIIRLSKMGIVSLTTSMYGAKSETHDDITKVKGSFQKTLENIKIIKENGIQCRVNYTLMKKNIGEVEEFVEMMKRIGVSYYIESNVVQTREGSTHTQDMRISREEYKSSLRKGLLEMPIDFICKSGGNRMRIDALGEVYPCEYVSFSFGNIKKEKFEDIWYGKEMKKFRKARDGYLPKECEKCDVKDSCGRCPAFIWKKGEYINTKTQDMCVKARAAVEVKKERLYIVPGDGVISREYEKYILVISGKSEKKIVLNGAMADLWKMICNGVRRNVLGDFWRENIEGLLNVSVEGYLEELKSYNFIKENIESSKKDLFKVKKSMDRVINKLGLVITDKCNFKCPHCYNGDNRELEECMSIDMWEKTIQEIKEYGCFNVMITGGEPFTSAKLFPLMDILERNEMLFEINTNGSLIDEEKIIKLSKYRNLTKVNFTLYGTSEDTYENFTGVKMNPMHIAHCVKALKDKNIKSYIQFNFTKDKFQDAKRLGDFQRENDIEISREYSFIHGRVDNGNIEEYNMTSDQIEELVKDGIINIRRGYKPCMQCGGNRASVNPRGEVTLCEMSANNIFGNLFDKNFSEIWEGSRAQKYMRDKNLDSKCLKCELSDFCKRCDGISMIETGSKNRIPKRLCDYTKILQEVYMKNR